MFLAHRQFRLARKPEAGLSCDADGVSLGGIQLLRRTDAGFAPRTALEIDVLTKAAYGAAFDTRQLTSGLAVASRALNAGDLGRAMIATLHLRLPALDADGVARLGAVNAALAKYSPDQPRDWHGRWTAEGAGSGGPSDATEAKQPMAQRGGPSDGNHAADRSPGGGSRHKRPSDQGETTGLPPASAGTSALPIDAGPVSHPTGGQLIDARYQAEGGDSAEIGDNGGPPLLRPEGPRGLPPDPDPVLPIPKVPAGWDQPYRVVNGVPQPAGRYPKLPDGRPWPQPEPDVVYRMLDRRRGARPYVKLYVPIDGKGPMLMGTTEQGDDYIEPPGYQAVYLRGAPQRTMSGGVETGHALESVVRALEFARTNNYSDIFFNRSITVITSGGNQAQLRPDVAALYRPGLFGDGEFDVWEVLSPGQKGPERELALRPVASRMRGFDSRAYKLLLKLLRALGIS